MLRLTQVLTARGTNATQSMRQAPIATALVRAAGTRQTGARATATVAQRAGSVLTSSHTAEPGALEAGLALQHLDGTAGVHNTASCEAFAVERKPAAGLMTVSANLPGFARKFSRARRCVNMSSSCCRLMPMDPRCNAIAQREARHAAAQSSRVIRRSAKRFGLRRMCYANSAGIRCMTVTGLVTRPARASLDTRSASESYTTTWQRIALTRSKPRCAILSGCFAGISCETAMPLWMLCGLQATDLDNLPHHTSLAGHCLCVTHVDWRDGS